MKCNDIYKAALQLLGYADIQNFKERAVVIINQIYFDLFQIVGSGEFVPVKTLSDNVNLPERVIRKAMFYGVAEQLALGEGDGELQQYFAVKYDRERRGINRTDAVVDIMP